MLETLGVAFPHHPVEQRWPETWVFIDRKLFFDFLLVVEGCEFFHLLDEGLMFEFLFRFDSELLHLVREAFECVGLGNWFLHFHQINYLMESLESDGSPYHTHIADTFTH